MRFSVIYDISGVSELPLDYRGRFVALIKTALEKSNNKEYYYQDIHGSAPVCFAIRFDRKPDIKDGRIFIGKNIRLCVSSPSLILGTAIYNGLISIKEFAIYKMKITNPLASYMKEASIQHNNVTFVTLSPVVIRHCQQREKYILPNEDGFAQSMQKTLLDEWLLYNARNSYNDIKVEFLKFKKVVMTHYDGLVLGFTGVLHMTSSPHILRFFYQAGIGYRRSNGFGFVEVDS